MLSAIKQGIKDRLIEVYPTGYTIYDEELPAVNNKPSFYLMLTNQNYNRRMNNRFTSLLSFDLAYYSNSTEVRTDCIRVQQDLLKAFHTVSGYHVLNRNARIIENVLHLTFDVRYSEMIEEEKLPMQQQQTNTVL